MRISTLLGALCFALALPGGAWAQSSQSRTQPQARSNSTSTSTTDNAGPEAQLWELVLGGTGNSNTQSHSGSQFSGQGFLGYYLTEAWQLNFRQGFSYNNPNGYGNSSRLALDYMIGDSNVVPFLGANGGVNYGSAVRDSYILSPEAGIKWWLRPEVFLMLLGEYQLTYRSGESNVFVYTFGVGYNW